MNYELFKTIARATEAMRNAHPYPPKPSQLPIGFLSAPSGITINPEPIRPVEATFFAGGDEEFLNWIKQLQEVK